MHSGFNTNFNTITQSSTQQQLGLLRNFLIFKPTVSKDENVNVMH
jgi:hypothetical protein